MKAGMVAEPVNMFDTAPDCGGAAALLLTAQPSPVRIAASALATDTLAIHDRQDALEFAAVRRSATKAFHSAGITPQQVNVLELFDAYPVFSVLSLEASGFAERGKGWELAQKNEISITGTTPLSTFGGLKARGNPGGATGLYQAGQVVLQLRGQAGKNQVKDARALEMMFTAGELMIARRHNFQRVYDLASGCFPIGTMPQCQISKK